MTTPKKTTRKAPAKRAAAKKTTTRRKAAKRAPAKKTAPKLPPKARDDVKTLPHADQICPVFADAIMHITGLPAADIKLEQLVKYAAVWGDLKCDALPKGVGLVVLFGHQIHGPLIARLLRKTLGMPVDGGVDDAVIEDANQVNCDWLILNLASLIIRRAAFLPSAHANLTETARDAILVCLHTMEVHCTIPVSDADADKLLDAMQEKPTETGDKPEGAEGSKSDENPAEKAAGVLHEPGTDGVQEQQGATAGTQADAQGAE